MEILVLQHEELLQYQLLSVAYLKQFALLFRHNHSVRGLFLVLEGVWSTLVPLFLHRYGEILKHIWEVREIAGT